MRIGAGAQPPQLPSAVPRVGPMPTATERAVLLRLAALVASTPESFAAPSAPPQPTNLVPLPLVANLPSPSPPAAPSLLGAPAGASSPALTGAERPTVESLLQLGNASPKLALPPASIAGQTAANSAPPPALLVAADRLTLSTATAVLRTAPTSPSNQAAAEFAQDLLSALTGEPRGRLLLTAFGQPMPTADPEAVAGLATRGPGALLQLLLRGVVQTADARQINMTLGMAVQRQAGAATLDAALLGAIQSALDQLATTALALDYPGDSAALAGRSASFQAVLDPRGLWPMQSFVLSGLLVLGRARDEAEIGEFENDEAEDADNDAEDRQHEAEAEEAPPRLPRKKKRERTALDEPTPLPADGGPPIISADRWLELELRHWRRQLRLWMSLPAESLGLSPS